MENTLPWVEKYRPDDFDDIVLDKYNRTILTNMLHEKTFSNVIFYRDMLNQGKNIEDSIIEADLICFINPNNPSGKILRSKYIADLIEKNPNKMFLVDESFIDYSEESSIFGTVKETSKNFIILKSLSKAYGVPGLRLGYAYTKNLNLYQYISDNLPIWGINSLAENFLEISLKYREDLKKSFERSKVDRQYLVANLEKIPFINKVFESHSSFVTFSIEDSFWSLNLRTYLINKFNIYLKEILINDDTSIKYFRVALTDMKGIDFFIDSLKKYLISKKI